MRRLLASLALGAAFLGAGALLSSRSASAAGFSAASPFFNDAVAGTVVQVKGTAGQLYGMHLVNTTGSVAYLQVFWLPSTSVTLGTTTPAFDVRLAANADLMVPMAVGVGQGSGISLAGTTTATGSTGAAISVTAFFQ